MKVGRVILCFIFFFSFISSLVLSNNTFDIEIFCGLSGVKMEDYNKYIDVANDKNKDLNVNTGLKKIEKGITPEINFNYNIKTPFMIIGLYLKNQFLIIFDSSTVAEWGSGRSAQVIDADFNVFYSGLGCRLSIANNEPPYLTGFIGVDGGICYYFWNNMYEATYQETGGNIYEIRKNWSTMIPGMNIEAGINWMFNETIGFGLKGGYRLASGVVNVKINNINGWTGPTASEDVVDYSGFFGLAGLIIKFNIQSEADKEGQINKNSKFPGLSEWIYKEAKSLYEEGLYKQAKEKILEAEKIAGDNELIIKLKEQIDNKLSSENTVEKISRLLKQADDYRYKRKYKNARKLYKEVISIDTENKQARFYLDEFDNKAKEEYNKAVELVNHGKLKKSLKSVELAIEYGMEKEAEDLKNEIENKLNKSNKKNTLYNEGVDKYRKGEYEEAINKWQEVLIIDPEDKEAKKNIDKAMEKIKEMNKEEERIITKNIEEAKNFYNIGNFDGALKKCEFVLRLKPDNDECKKMIEEIKKIQEQNKVEVIEKR
mgnify:CR=1 FL=1|jgi:tetratricopeptide (TPR) repeat protein